MIKSMIEIIDIINLLVMFLIINLKHYMYERW